MEGAEPKDLLKKKKKPAKAAKPAKAKASRKVSEDDLQRIVFDQVSDAVSYIQEAEISEARLRATEYYKGNLPDIDLEDAAEEDRSRAVMTEVRDTVLGMMPDLLRIFYSADGLVKYTPVASPDPQVFALREQQAREATSYVQDIVLGSDNPDNFRTFHDAFQDALVRRTGIIKYWWDKSKKPTYQSYTGLAEQDVIALTSSDDVEIVRKSTRIDTQAVGEPAITYDIMIRRVDARGRVCIEAVPCEQVFVSRAGRSMDKTPVFGYSEEREVGDFVALGFSEEDLEDADNDPDSAESLEAQARQPGKGGAFPRASDDPPEDPSQRKVKYTEAYLRADMDGDGIAELIQVIAAGTSYKILDWEPVDEIPFADFCPYLEAHVFIGESAADLTMDIQRIKSRIIRDVLDSLAQSVTPQTTVVEGKVNLDDVLNPDTSKVIRQEAPGMVQPLVVPFVGKEALPILDLMTQVREQRTGQSEASQGLDAGVLQSSTQAAVSATLTKAQSRTEMVARVFAETGMKRLFRGILKLLVRYQTEPRMVLLKGRAVSATPSQWSPDMDVVPTVALGRGSQQEQIGFLAQLLLKQEQILQNLGFDNPIVTIEQYYYTLSKLVELGGYRNVDSFFTDPAKNPQALAQFKQSMAQKAQQAAQGQQGQGQNPQVQMAKIQADQQYRTQELAIRKAELQAKTQLEGARLTNEAHAKLLEVHATHATTMDKAHLEAAVEMATARLKAATQIKIEHMEQQSVRMETNSADDA
jgi:hypothetical protein